MTQQTPSLPAHLPLDEVARHAGIEPETYRRWLKARGATRLIGGVTRVRTDELRQVDTDVYQRVLAARTFQDDVEPQTNDDDR